jgi:hypothetical protein
MPVNAVDSETLLVRVAWHTLGAKLKPVFVSRLLETTAEVCKTVNKPNISPSLFTSHETEICSNQRQIRNQPASGVHPSSHGTN